MKPIQPPSPPLPIQDTPENPATHAGKASNRITCARCTTWWTGLTAAHCAACHQTFTSTAAFTSHRTGNQCTNPADHPDRYTPAGRPWPGWSLPGTWRGPDN